LNDPNSVVTAGSEQISWFDGAGLVALGGGMGVNPVVAVAGGTVAGGSVGNGTVAVAASSPEGDAVAVAVGSAADGRLHPNMSASPMRSTMCRLSFIRCKLHSY
jgi:hypothetical protein